LRQAVALRIVHHLGEADCDLPSSPKVDAPRERDDGPSTCTTAAQFVATKTPCASFRADTLVLMADGTKKPISEVEVGDEVVATDPVTGKTSVRTVTRLFTHIDDDLLDLVVLTEDGVETIHTTDHHRFWNDTSKTWVEAKDLKSGERLLTADGDLVTVGELKRVPGSAPMLYLTVEYDHTFYVALNDTAVLVHNQNCKLSSPNPVTNKSIRNEYEEIITGRGTPRIDPATGQQTIHRGGSRTRQWSGALEWEVPGGKGHRILEKTLPDGRKVYGYVVGHDYNVIKTFPGPWYPDGGKP
jgi:Pretoxin HINT domain